MATPDQTPTEQDVVGLSARSDALVRPFWLSHQRANGIHKCFRFGSVRVCARCLGTYPVILAALVVQLRRPFSPVTSPFDPVLLWALPMPAVIDWSLGQLTTWRGSNAVRLVSGGLLGISLGRTIYLNMRHPGDLRVLLQIAALSAAAGIVWGLGQVLRYRTGSSE